MSTYHLDRLTLGPAKATASLEIERIAGRVATEFWQARIATLETAIRDLAKVLP